MKPPRGGLTGLLVGNLYGWDQGYVAAAGLHCNSDCSGCACSSAVDVHSFLSSQGDTDCTQEGKTSPIFIIPLPENYRLTLLGIMGLLSAYCLFKHGVSWLVQVSLS